MTSRPDRPAPPDRPAVPVAAERFRLSAVSSFGRRRLHAIIDRYLKELP